MDKKIVAICGLQGAGKDTTADKLIEITKSKGLKVGKMAFADRLKDMLSVLFDLPRDQLAGFTPESRIWREQELPKWSKRLGKPVTPRYLMQYFGTELLREHFCDTVWIDCLMDSIEKSNLDVIIITDCRYPNEMKALIDQGAKIIEVKRHTPEWYYEVLTNPDYIPEGVHKSEYEWIRPLKYLKDDYLIQIDNNGTLEELYDKIVSIYEKI